MKKLNYSVVGFTKEDIIAETRADQKEDREAYLFATGSEFQRIKAQLKKKYGLKTDAQLRSFIMS